MVIAVNGAHPQRWRMRTATASLDNPADALTFTTQIVLKKGENIITFASMGNAGPNLVDFDLKLICENPDSAPTVAVTVPYEKGAVAFRCDSPNFLRYRCKNKYRCEIGKPIRSGIYH